MLSVASPPIDITGKINAFLDKKIVKPCREEDSPTPVSFPIRDFVLAFLRELQASEEIQKACKVDVSLTGSYLANQVVGLHPVTGDTLHPMENDRDIKFQFTIRFEESDLEDSIDKSELYCKVHAIATRCLYKFLGLQEGSLSLRDIGIHGKRFILINGRIGSGSIELQGAAGDSPLQLTMTVVDEFSPPSYLTKVDSLYVPIQTIEGQLGSNKAGEFILLSKDGTIEEVLQDFERRVISCSQKDWDPAHVSFFELARYLLLVCERWREESSQIFSCLYTGAIRKCGESFLLPKLLKTVKEKRRDFPSYPFVFLCNLLFHATPAQASIFLESIKQARGRILFEKSASWAHSLAECLYTREGMANPDVLQALSCQVPLLAKRIVSIEHLSKKQLQCCFVDNEREFSIVVPIPSEENNRLSWMREIFMADCPDEKKFEVLSATLSSLLPDQQEPFTYKLLEQILPYLQEHGSLWMEYKSFLGSQKKIQDWVNALVPTFLDEDLSLSASKEELFFQVLALDKGEFSGEVLRNLSDIHEIPVSFWSKLEKVLEKHAAPHKFWQILCIRWLMEMPSTFPCLSILLQRSGIANVDPSNFRKILDSEGKRCWFAWKRAVLFKDSSYIVESLSTISNEQIEEIRKHFSKIEMHSIFLHLIDTGKMQEVALFVDCQRKIWGLQEVLPWYVELFNCTQTLETAALCRSIALQALQVGVNPWFLYSLFSRVPFLFESMKPYFENPPSTLSTNEKKSCLESLLNQISLLLDSQQSFEKIFQYISYLPLLGATEIQIRDVLVNSFHLYPGIEQKRKVASLMRKLAPNITNGFLQDFKSPSVRKKDPRLQFLNEWIFALFESSVDLEYFSFFVEHLHQLVLISSDRTVALARSYINKGSEKEKQQIALACAKLVNGQVAQQIFDTVDYIHCGDSWTLSDIQQVWNLVKAPTQSWEQKCFFVSTAFPHIKHLSGVNSLVGELKPYMEEALQKSWQERKVQEIDQILEKVQKALHQGSKTQRPSLAALEQEPLLSNLWQNAALYQKLLSIICENFDSLWNAEKRAIPVLLKEIPKNLSPEFCEMRKTAVLLYIQKMIEFPKVEVGKRSVKNSESSKISAGFLQKIAPKIEFLSQSSEFVSQVQEHIHNAFSLPAETLVYILSWIQKDTRSPLEEDIFLSAVKVLFLCLRSNQPQMAADLLQFLCEDIEQNGEIRKIYSWYLPLLSELLMDYPNLVQKEHVQKIARQIIEKTSELDCSDTTSIGALRLLGFFFKTYLRVISELPESKWKEIDFSFMNLTEDYILSPHEYVDSGTLLECSMSVLFLYAKTGKMEEAKAWIHRWFSMQRSRLQEQLDLQRRPWYGFLTGWLWDWNPPSDVFCENLDHLKRLLDHYQAFLCFARQTDDHLLGKEEMENYKNLLQMMRDELRKYIDNL